MIGFRLESTSTLWMVNSRGLLEGEGFMRRCSGRGGSGGRLGIENEFWTAIDRGEISRLLESIEGD